MAALKSALNSSLRVAKSFIGQTSFDGLPSQRLGGAGKNTQAHPSKTRKSKQGLKRFKALKPETF
ncbi:hypothetical protein, partial [Helicobacter ailurogastricus]|uniref:hypothetical protein n=1 Tax=Helicobacter ailurogastricus TaxID=1578720 RepID=UPI0025522D39